MSADDDATIDVLLRHRTFVRGLARHLLVDPDAADDVVQQTWIAALRHAHDGRPVERSWLARIARNFAFNRRRDQARREAREARAPAFAPLPSPAEIVAAEDERRRVVDAVLALDEPFLTTMLLRYLRDQSESEVATQLGVPLETVRWRLKTARARLRSRLSGDDDEPRSARALVALAGWSADEAAAAIAGGKGLILVGTGAWMGLVASLVVAVWLGWWIVDDRSRAPSLPASAAPIVDASATGNGDAPGAREPGATGASSVTRTARTTEPTGARVTPRENVVLGRCVSRDGAVVVGARVASALASDAVLTDHDGRFSLVLPIHTDRSSLAATQLELVVSARHHATKRVPFLSTTSLAIELGDIELSIAGALHGRVLDGADRPLPAQIDLVRGNPDSEAWWSFEPRAAEPTLVERITAAADGTFVVDSIEEGWYALVPSSPEHTIDAAVPVAITANGRTDVVVRMRSATPAERITVLVNDEVGVPLAGARVLWTREPDGRTGRGPTRRTLTADATGTCSLIVRARSTHGFAVTYADGRVASVLGVRGGDPRVVLAPETCAIAAVGVVDASTQTPCPGARVTFAAIGDDDDDRGRSSANGARDRGTAAARAASRARRFGDPRASRSRLDPMAFRATQWSGVTDPTGVARVPVPSEPFVIEVTHPRYQRFRSGPFEPGVVPPIESIALQPVAWIHGIVVAAEAPVAGARVSWMADDGDGRRDGRESHAPPSFTATTRSDGTFEMPAHEAGRGPAGRKLCVESFEHAPTTARLDPATASSWSATQPLRIDLPVGGELRGSVRTTGERTAPGLVVAARSDAGIALNTRVAWDGTYAFERMHAGTWSLCVSAADIDPNDARWASASDSVRIESGGITTYDLTWTPAVAVQLSGDLRLDGVALFGTRVHVGPMGRSTDIEAVAIERAPVNVDIGPSGAYRTGVGSVGPHLFAVTVDDGSIQLVARRAVRLESGPNTASLVLDCGRVAGTCGHPNDGHVFLRATLLDATQITMRIPCAADGSFAAQHVPAGTYRIRGASDAKTIEVHVSATTTVELK